MLAGKGFFRVSQSIKNINICLSWNSTRGNSSTFHYIRVYSTVASSQIVTDQNNKSVNPESHARDKSVDYKLRGKGRNFIDFVRVVVNGGHGGDGCVSFHREKFIAKGPPDGGNGGLGGNVYFVASSDETTLNHVNNIIRADHGRQGQGSWKQGRSGKDFIVKLPVGTIVKEVDPPEKKSELDDKEDRDLEEDANKQLKKMWVHYPGGSNEQTGFWEAAQKTMKAEEKYLQWLAKKDPEDEINVDLMEPGQQILVAKGGAGGHGNPFFATNDNRGPKFATRGRLGQTRYFELELKTIADIGLVGAPNAGKSTLLTAISNAHPKIAPYPFTTLNPYIGTVDYTDGFQITVADIPGLIEGAHRNIGLGHSFLRHVERSKILVYVIDISKNEAWRDFEMLQTELETYQHGLTNRPSLIVANKADIVKKTNFENFEKQVKEILESSNRKHSSDVMIVPISAKDKKNILKVTTLLRRAVEQNYEQKNNSSSEALVF